MLLRWFQNSNYLSHRLPVWVSSRFEKTTLIALLSTVLHSPSLLNTTYNIISCTNSYIVMAPQNQNPFQDLSPKFEQPGLGRFSWLRRIRQRVSTPLPWAQIWQNVQNRNTTMPDLATRQQALSHYTPFDNGNIRQESKRSLPFATRIIRFGRRLSTPVQIYRPSTAPPNPNSITFRPIRWELQREDTPISDKSSAQVTMKKECPYDPEVLKLFGDFEPSTSICGLGTGWPWSARHQIHTPCNDCLHGTERAHINVSPSQFFKRRSNTQQHRKSANNSREDASNPNKHPKQVEEFGIERSRPARVSHLPWQSSLQNSSNWNLREARSPERMGHRREKSESEATFNRLRQAVENARSSSSRPRSPPPKLHQLSPDVAFIHRDEITAHQAAIREGRHSPVLEYQARGRSPVDVIGYHLTRERIDSSSTVLYAERGMPGEYAPPTPQEVPSPTRIISPFSRRSINLMPGESPVLSSRLDHPPFVPALPPGTVLRPVSEWGRPHSAPESWESVLRHSAVYRSRDTDHSPRVPSPLQEQYGPRNFDSEWSHGTTPLNGADADDTYERFKKANSNGDVKGPTMRGGGFYDLQRDVFMSREDVLRHWDEWTKRRGSGPAERIDSAPRYQRLACKFQRPDACMQTTDQMPRLRGGAGEADRKPANVPASLLYLAGGTGRKPGQSISVESWNRMKPKKRMGGLLGMMVFGHNSGKSYIPETRNQEVQTDPCISAVADTGTGNE